MTDVGHVRVALYWGGKTIHDADTVRYSCGPRVFVKLPVSLTYASLVRLLHHKMESSIEEVKLVISGRFPYTVVGQNVCYTEMPIIDDESLQDFLVVPDTVRSFMSLILLEMYIKSEVVASKPPSDVMNTISDMGYLTMVVTQNTQPQPVVPSESCGQGNQNVSTKLSVGTFPSFGFADGAGTSRTSKIGDVPTVSQIQVRVSSDHCVDGSDDDSDGDAPHDSNESDEITDSGDESDDDDQRRAEDVSNVPVKMDVNIGDVPTVSQIQARMNSDRRANGSHDNSDVDAPHDSNESDEITDSRDKSDVGDQQQAEVVSNVPVQMDEVSSLSELQGRPEASASTRESENIDSRVWMDWKLELKTGMLFASKEDLRSAVILWNLHHNRDFFIWESSRKFWKAVCGRWESGCQWMIRGRKTPSNLWMVGYQSKTDLWRVGKYWGIHSCRMEEPSKNGSFVRQAKRMRTTNIRYAMDIGRVTISEICAICKETGHHWRRHRRWLHER